MSIEGRRSRTSGPQGWLIQVGVLCMAFGIGGFLGYLAGRMPAPPPAPLVDTGTVTRAERHANSADYLTRRLTVGVSRLERSHR